MHRTPGSININGQKHMRKPSSMTTWPMLDTLKKLLEHELLLPNKSKQIQRLRIFGFILTSMDREPWVKAG